MLRNGRQITIPVVLKSEDTKPVAVIVQNTILDKLGIQIDDLTPWKKTNNGIRQGVKVAKSTLVSFPGIPK
jgi:hypothetical protein